MCVRWFTSARHPPPYPRQLALCPKTPKTKNQDGLQQPRRRNLQNRRISCHLHLSLNWSPSFGLCLWKLKKKSLLWNELTFKRLWAMDDIMALGQAIDSTMQLTFNDAWWNINLLHLTYYICNACYAGCNGGYVIVVVLNIYFPVVFLWKVTYQFPINPTKK